MRQEFPLLLFGAGIEATKAIRWYIIDVGELYRVGGAASFTSSVGADKVEKKGVNRLQGVLAWSEEGKDGFQSSSERCER